MSTFETNDTAIIERANRIRRQDATVVRSLCDRIPPSVRHRKILCRFDRVNILMIKLRNIGVAPYFLRRHSPFFGEIELTVSRLCRAIAVAWPRDLAFNFARIADM